MKKLHYILIIILAVFGLVLLIILNHDKLGITSNNEIIIVSDKEFELPEGWTVKSNNSSSDKNYYEVILTNGNLEVKFDLWKDEPEESNAYARPKIFRDGLGQIPGVNAYQDLSTDLVSSIGGILHCIDNRCVLSDPSSLDSIVIWRLHINAFDYPESNLEISTVSGIDDTVINDFDSLLKILEKSKIIIFE